MGITVKIFISLLSGLIVGLILNLTPLNNIPMIREIFTDGLFFVVGQIFIRLLQMLVVPVVFLSLVCGTAGLGDLRRLGRVGGKSLFLYLITTVIAVALGCLFAGMIEPGVGFNITRGQGFNPSQGPSLKETLIAIFPRNPIEAFSKGEMLPVIVFAMFFGVATTLSGKAGESTLKGFTALNEVMMKLVDLVIALSPVGVFFLVAKVFSEQGFDAVLPLGKYFFTVLLVLLIQVGFVYSLLLKIVGGLSPIKFFKKFNEVMLFAFSTASSNATIPVTLDVIEKRLGVKNSVASFTIPLGATVNMDGTAIMQGVATLFVAQAYGIHFGLKEYLLVIITATLASIGTAGVPGVGLVMLAMVFQQVGLPLEGIGMVMAVDRPLDMARTAVNVTGDGVVSCVVAKSEKEFDSEIYNSN